VCIYIYIYINKVLYIVITPTCFDASYHFQDDSLKMMLDASKHVAVLTVHKIYLILLCCAFVGLDNKLYKTHGTYIKKM
jgi:hypothetical protein